jgi:hypothetical protein
MSHSRIFKTGRLIFKHAFACSNQGLLFMKALIVVFQQLQKRNTLELQPCIMHTTVFMYKIVQYPHAINTCKWWWGGTRQTEGIRNHGMHA